MYKEIGSNTFRLIDVLYSFTKISKREVRIAMRNVEKCNY